MKSEDDLESVEALSWLEQADGKERTVGEDSAACLHTEDAVRLVRELYAAGAVEVVARIALVEYEFEEASGLTVMLPRDREKRVALFGIAARVLREMGRSVGPDGERGQDSFRLGMVVASRFASIGCKSERLAADLAARRVPIGLARSKFWLVTSGAGRKAT